MLPKSQRIPRKLFPKVSAGFFHSPNFILRTAPAPAAKFAVSVSKKVSASATVRNKVRRRVYSALKDLIPKAKNNFYVFVAKKGAETIKGESLKKEIAQLLQKS